MPHWARGSTSSDRRRGKPTRRAIDDDWVVLEPDDEGFLAIDEGLALMKNGASVAIKTER